jgi:hypothetical protein
MRVGTIVLGVLGFAALGTGCRVNAEAKASTSGEARADVRAEGNETTSAPEPAPQPPPAQPAPEPAPAPVAASSCPVACYVASGAARLPVTAEEQAQLTSALAPVFGRMHVCTEGGHRSLRHRSPVLNLRIAPDGRLEDLGVDPGHGWSEACMDSAARDGNVQLSLPGRTTVRCHEQCAPAAPAPSAAAAPPPRKKKRR